ncbi:VanW family protein [Actinoplanes sp. URMC 104]|uniref:VanW family protein n=1 Tax=Actinoplanes sp. URMC 104 TaxID=3423409 RepID=UPI003F1D983F
MTSRPGGSVEPPPEARPGDALTLNEAPAGADAAAGEADATVPMPRRALPEESLPAPRRRRGVLAAGVVALVAAGAGAVAYVTTGDIPRGTRVLGLDLGGLSRAEAVRELGARAVSQGGRAARVRLDGKEITLQPGTVGLALDVPATVDAAASGGLVPFGTRDVAPVVRVDAAELEAALRERVDRARITVTKAAITFRGVAPVASYARAGLDLDGALAAERVTKAWPAGQVADVPLTTRPPAMTRAQVDELVAGVAKPAVAAPVTVTAGGRSFRLSPAAIAKGLVFRSDSAGRLTPVIDGAKLRAAAPAGFREVETPAEPATVRLQGGKPRVVPGAPGRLVDLTRLGSALLEVLPRAAPRTVTAPLAESGPDTSVADVTRLGIKEKVSTFTTYFTGGRNAPRSRNIITIAEDVDGAIVRPGETFSLNGHTGERNYAAGYKDAPVIVNGVLEPGVGGGASQFTTTLFNAAYYAGLQDVEHKPHSFWFSRYPAVIESTIFYPTLDLKFKNTTPYGILIDTATTGRSVTVTMWSTKVYDSVKTVYGPRRNVTSPPTVHREPGPKCLTSSGLPGFTQDAWRVIRKDGREVEREKFSWRYDPEPRFVCGDQ